MLRKPAERGTLPRRLGALTCPGDWSVQTRFSGYAEGTGGKGVLDCLMSNSRMRALGLFTGVLSSVPSPRGFSVVLGVFLSVCAV